MHELLIVATVPEKKVKGVLMILQGLCAMTPTRQLEWRIIFEGPKSTPLSGIGSAQIQTRKPTNLQLWKELHDQLVRQSYYLTVVYNVDESIFGRASSAKDGENPAEEKSLDVEQLRGTLRFLDIPDPPGTRPANSRLVIPIKDELQLPTFLTGIRYNYSRDFVRESYYAYRDNVIFCLYRDLQRPEIVGSDQHGSAGGMPHELPEFSTLRPFDGEHKWMLMASVEVSDGNQPILMQKGLDQLNQVKQDLDGICDFVISPRQQLDTRIQLSGK